MIDAMLFLLPASRLKNALLRLIGHSVASTARIGTVLVVSVGHVEISDGARVGPFNVFRDLKVLRIRDHASIGQWNWVSAAAPLARRGAPASLELASESAVTSRHYLDCTGGIAIGRLSTVAGVRSTFITHGIDYVNSRQSFDGIRIGEKSIVSSNTCLTPGSIVPDLAIVAMGATVTARSDRSSSALLAGVPARAVKPIAGAYFSRTAGPVDLPRR